MVKSIALLCLVVLFSQCSNKETVVDPYAAIKAKFPTTINATSLADYTGQGRPTYITKDNTGTNSISNARATLGRVLFYDKNLSSTTRLLAPVVTSNPVHLVIHPFKVRVSTGNGSPRHAPGEQPVFHGNKIFLG